MLAVLSIPGPLIRTASHFVGSPSPLISAASPLIVCSSSKLAVQGSSGGTCLVKNTLADEPDDLYALYLQLLLFVFH